MRAGTTAPLASAAFGATVLLSLVVLFAPSDGGVAAFPQSDKLVHATLFALLAGTARWRFGARLGVLAAVAAYAPLSELVQAGLLPGRHGDVLDVVADLAGTGVGWLLSTRWPPGRARAGRPGRGRLSAGR